MVKFSYAKVQIIFEIHSFFCIFAKPKYDLTKLNYNLQILLVKNIFRIMNDFVKIKNNITSIIPVTTDEWDVLQNKIETIVVNKNDFFLKENSICNSIAFVESGSLIYYKTLDNGNEITIDFAFTGEWMTDNYSRLNNKPSHLNIKAIENSELLIIRHKNLTELYEKIPRLERFSRILIEQAYVKLVQHSIDLQTLSATDRYLKLLKTYPNIVQSVPLYHIANYLGIAPKSLSRIRASIFSSEK
jgi:CRP-like cAMP-binding protein